MSGSQRVKICGISDPLTAEFAADAGADFIGVVFYPGSHRYVEPDRAQEVAAAVRQDGRERATRVVGLFVNVPVEDVVETYEQVGLDMVQLSGSESTEYMQAIASQGIPFVGTVRSGGEPRQKTERRFHEIIENEPYAVHFDTHVPGMWGGSGVVGDWTLAREFARDYPTFLAGGLDADNVRAAVCEVQPFVVDVSSGVETNNVKDHAKIKAFIEAAKCQEDENR